MLDSLWRIRRYNALTSLYLAVFLCYIWQLISESPMLTNPTSSPKTEMKLSPTKTFKDYVRYISFFLVLFLSNPSHQLWVLTTKEFLTLLTFKSLPNFIPNIKQTLIELINFYFPWNYQKTIVAKHSVIWRPSLRHLTKCICNVTFARAF